MSADFLVDLVDVATDTSNGGVLVNSQVNKFVRDDVHLLERKSLNAGSGETFEDPALVVFLSFLDFLLHGLNNDVIFNVLEAGKALSNLLAVLMLRFVSNTAEDITS